MEAVLFYSFNTYWLMTIDYNEIINLNVSCNKKWCHKIYEIVSFFFLFRKLFTKYMSIYSLTVLMNKLINRRNCHAIRMSSEFKKTLKYFGYNCWLTSILTAFGIHKLSIGQERMHAKKKRVHISNWAVSFLRWHKP